MLSWLRDISMIRYKPSTGMLSAAAFHGHIHVLTWMIGDAGAGPCAQAAPRRWRKWVVGWLDARDTNAPP